MFTQAAFRTCVFFFQTLLLSNSVFLSGRVFAFDSTHTEDGNFQLREIIFLEYRAHKAVWLFMSL